MKLSSVLITLHSSSGSKSVLRAGAELAYRAQAELRAVFVEDIEWFEASKHSFTQQISSYTGNIIPFSEENITEQSRALGTALQQMFTSISEMMHIKYTYRSVRGQVSRELLESAEEADLVIIGRSGQLGYRKKTPGKTCLELVDKCTLPVLVWNQGIGWPRLFIGLGSTAQKSIPVIKWTFKLGEIMGRDYYLFFPSEDAVAEGWKGQPIEMEDDRPITLDRINMVSEIHPLMGPDILQYYKNELIIVQRNNLIESPGEFLQKVQNPVLLL